MIKAMEVDIGIEVQIRGDLPTIGLELMELMREVRHVFENEYTPEGAKAILVELGNLSCMEDIDEANDYVLSGEADAHIEALKDFLLKGETE